MFDLNKIAAIETQVVPFRDGNNNVFTDENGNELGVLVTGPTTPAHMKARERMGNKIMKDAQLPQNKRDPKVSESAVLEFLAAVIVEPHNFSIGELKGKEAVTAFLEQPQFKLYVDQVASYLLKTDNFLPSA